MSVHQIIGHEHESKLVERERVCYCRYGELYRTNEGLEGSSMCKQCIKYLVLKMRFEIQTEAMKKEIESKIIVRG